AERLGHEVYFGYHRQHWSGGRGLACPAAQVARKAIAKASKIESRQPGLGLGARGPAVDTIQNKPERDIVARGLPREQRIILKQDADLRTRKAGLDGARKVQLQADYEGRTA